MLSFTITKSSISLFFDGTFYSIDKSHVNFETIANELKKPDAERDRGLLTEWLNVRNIIALLTAGKVKVAEDGVFYDGREVNNYMSARMIELLTDGYDVTPWALFMDNVWLNPADYARDELYEWMEKAEMPITPDGQFLAFKKVRDDYKDCHSGTFDNSPGSILEMPRDACDPNRGRTCSTGFHFCSVGYLPHFWGDRIVVVKINPRDVTSIPNDYGFAKGRCCRYEVVGELSYADSANASCFKSNVADIEDPAEFPPELVKLVPVKPSFPTAEEIEQAQRDANRTIMFSNECRLEITADEAMENMLHRNCSVTPEQQAAVARKKASDALADTAARIKVPLPQTPSEADINAALSTLFTKTGEAMLRDKVKTALWRESASVITESGTLGPLEKLEIANKQTMLLPGGSNIDHLRMRAVEIRDQIIAEQRAREDAARPGPRPRFNPPGRFPEPPKPGSGSVTNWPDGWTGGPIRIEEEMTDAGKAAPPIEGFITRDKRSFTCNQIDNAMVYASGSIRGAARMLDIQDSTLRGWLKQMGR